MDRMQQAASAGAAAVDTGRRRWLADVVYVSSFEGARSGRVVIRDQKYWIEMVSAAPLSFSSNAASSNVAARKRGLGLLLTP